VGSTSLHSQPTTVAAAAVATAALASALAALAAEITRFVRH
tara:strand:+ start:271 stop:393 length:123 start_codon:yes stop_codon:yes gene_type:complete